MNGGTARARRSRYCFVGRREPLQPMLFVMCNSPSCRISKQNSWILRSLLQSAMVAAACLILLCPPLCFCQPQPRSVLCRAGNGNFDVETRTGVRVHVGAARERGAATLATRACAARLGWEKQELLMLLAWISETVFRWQLSRSKSQTMIAAWTIVFILLKNRCA